ncbi:MAG: DNA-processing protein DprA [Steroidobacteraceae bacterium]
MNELPFLSPDAPSRAASHRLELGAYEALWMRERASFRSLARLFRLRPGALPSDIVTRAQAEKYGRMALALAKEADIGAFDLLVHGTRSYPGRLRDAAHPVEVLYCQGRPYLLELRCVAIVGTRQPSRPGQQLAEQLARHLARSGLAVISGLAEGIDSIAHRAAIEAGGATVAVLGTPLTAVYPRANAGLQRELARDHLVVSQVPMVRYGRQDMNMNRQFFRERNATLAALAEAVVIVEAGDRSGALICARHALEMHRPLFVPDHCCGDASLDWPERLIRRGAVHLPSIESIAERLAI